MDLSVVIVSWNVCQKLQNNLKALFASQGLSFEVFVVDNNSADDTVKMVRENFPQVHLIANGQNLGFAKANNQALRLAKGKILLLLNPDMLVKGDTLKKFYDWFLDNDTADIAGCHLLDEHGLTIKHVRRFPTVYDQAAVALKLPHLFPKILDKYLATDFDYSRQSRVDSIRGSFFGIKRKTYEMLGGLDERFFIWFEEVDYCRQAKQAGLQVWYTPSAECIDYIGQGFKQVASPTKQRYFRDSMIKYFQKWHGPLAVLIIRIAWNLSFLPFAVAKILKIKK